MRSEAVETCQCTSQVYQGAEKMVECTLRWRFASTYRGTERGSDSLDDSSERNLCWCGGKSCRSCDAPHLRFT